MVKKLFILAQIIFASQFCFSQTKFTKELLKVIPKDVQNREYIAKNPLLAEKFFIKNLKSVKGKVIHETFTNYTLDKDGKMIFGEEYPNYSEFHTFTVFDKNGYIVKICDYRKNSNDYLKSTIESFEITNYQIEDSSITEKNISKETIDDKIIPSSMKNYPVKYSANYTDISVEFSRPVTQFECGFFKQGITLIKLVGKDNVHAFFKNGRQKLHYSGDKVSQEARYTNGKLVEIKYFNTETEPPTLKARMVYENNLQKRIEIKDGKENEEIIDSFTTEFDKNGFLTFCKKTPYNKVDGDYTIWTYKIIDKIPDEFLTKFDFENDAN